MSKKTYGGLILLIAFVGSSVLIPNPINSVSHGNQWSPVRVGTVEYVNSDNSLSIRQQNGSIIMIDSDGCNYIVGDTIQYQVSTVDPALGTQHVKVLC